jgi:anti-sigma factor RsiW
MSSCEFRERVDAYADGVLAGAARAEVEAHLARCEPCAAEARRQARLHQVLGAAHEIEPRAGFEAAFLRRLRQEAEPRAPWWKRWFPRPAWALAAAGAAAAAVVALAVWPREEARPRPAPVAEVPVDEVVRNLALLRNLDVIANLDVLEGVSAEELEAVSELPELGG